MEEFEQKVLTEHDDNAKKPVKSNMVENLKIETIEKYEKALALGDKDTVRRIEWELGTLTIHKKELREFVDRRKAEGLSAVPTDSDRRDFEEYKNPTQPYKTGKPAAADAKEVAIKESPIEEAAIKGEQITEAFGKEATIKEEIPLAETAPATEIKEGLISS